MPPNEAAVPSQDFSDPDGPVNHDGLEGKLDSLFASGELSKFPGSDAGRGADLHSGFVVSTETRDRCLEHVFHALNLPPDKKKVREVLLPIVNAALDAAMTVVRRAAPPAAPTVRVVRGNKGEPRCFSDGSNEKPLRRGRRGDSWLIMCLLTNHPRQWFTVKEVQALLDEGINERRWPVVRTRLAELHRRFPRAVEVEWVPGTHFRRYRFVGEVEDEQPQH